MPGARRSSTAGRKILRKDPLPKGRACLACKERKVKCNGQWPCSACVRHAKYEGRAFDSSCCEFRPSASTSQASQFTKVEEPVRSVSSSTSSSRSPPDSLPATPGNLSPTLATFTGLPMMFDHSAYMDVLAANAAHCESLPPPGPNQLSQAPPYAANSLPMIPPSIWYNATMDSSAPYRTSFINLDLPPRAQKTFEPPVPPRSEPFVLNADAVSEHLAQFEQFHNFSLGTEDSVAPAGLTPFLEASMAAESNTISTPFWAM